MSDLCPKCNAEVKQDETDLSVMVCTNINCGLKGRLVEIQKGVFMVDMTGDILEVNLEEGYFIQKSRERLRNPEPKGSHDD
jgi:hypothetical protein